MSTRVRPDQFIVTAEGITHRPTGATYSPYAGSPFSGNFYYGQLGNVLDTGEDYREDEVREMMMEVWAKYVGPER
jgi:hypothetical protein